MWSFVFVLFSLRSQLVICISVTRRWNLSHIMGFKQSFIAEKNEAFQGVFSVSFFSGFWICAAFGKISGWSRLLCPEPDTWLLCTSKGQHIRNNNPPVLSMIQAVTSPANCNLPNAFNKKVGESVASHPLRSWLSCRSYFRHDLRSCFFPESRVGMTCCSSLQGDDVSLFRASCKFCSTQKQTYLQPRCYFHACTLIWVFQLRRGQCLHNNSWTGCMLCVDLQG